jgi:hypothetical protein
MSRISQSKGNSESIFEYSINNNQKISDIDNKLINDMIGDGESFEVSKEIETTQQHIDDLKNQLLFLDRERIKKRVKLQ